MFGSRVDNWNQDEFSIHSHTASNGEILDVITWLDSATISAIIINANNKLEFLLAHNPLPSHVEMMFHQTRGCEGGSDRHDESRLFTARATKSPIPEPPQR